MRTALYQYYFMKQIPLYAIANESAFIAKRHCHPIFEKFLNGMLRQASNTPLDLPKGSTVQELAIRYSYPIFFVERIAAEKGKEAALNILEAGNQAAPIMFRVRGGEELGIAVLLDNSLLLEIAESSSYYIQNITPAFLIWNLCQKRKNEPPRKILDLCASPGGKLIALHDHFKSAQLFANDISESKIQKLKENCRKYGIEATITCSSGENYQSLKNSISLF